MHGSSSTYLEDGHDLVNWEIAIKVLCSESRQLVQEGQVIPAQEDQRWHTNDKTNNQYPLSDHEPIYWVGYTAAVTRHVLGSKPISCL